MALNWKDVKEALQKGEVDKIAEYRKRLLQLAEGNVMKTYLQGHSIQSMVAASWGDALIKHKADSKDVVANFQIDLLTEFASKHGLTAYTDVTQIQPGDTIAVTWKDKKKTYVSHYRVLQKYGNQWITSLSMWEHDEEQFKAHENAQTINNKNFVVGVRQQNPPIMRKPHKFYFINFTE